MDDQQNIIIYRTADGRTSVAIYAKDGKNSDMITINKYNYEQRNTIHTLPPA